MAVPGEESRWRRERETAAGRTSEGEPTGRGDHELRRARRESEEAPHPPESDAPRGGGGVAGAEGATGAPTPPASSRESEGEEDAIARYVFLIPAEEYLPTYG